MSRSSRNSRPATTSAHIRHHRWARGDWQLLPWIFGRAEGKGHAIVERDSCDRPVEDARQSASNPVRARCGARSARGLDVALHAALIWIVFVVLTIVLPTLSRSLPLFPRGARASRSRAICGRSAAISARPDALDADGRVPSGSGLADGRRDRPHPLALGVTRAICWNGFRRRRRPRSAP